MHRSSVCLALLVCFVPSSASASSGIVRTKFASRAYSTEHSCNQSVPVGHVHCDIEVVTHADTGRMVVNSSPVGGYTPTDLQDAYGVLRPAQQYGGDQTVAIVDAFDDPNAEADLGTYRAEYGLPACTTANGCFKKVNESGNTSPLPVTDGGWAQEISLDVDMVSAICPDCHILLVEASSAAEPDLAAAVDAAAAAAGVTQISNSYGGPETSNETTYDTHYHHPGIAITVSSGDDGYQVNYPAASPEVTAVGGTSLLEDDGTARGWTETAWSGAGSGCSAYEAKPSWQTTGCTKADGTTPSRAVADVSAVADGADPVNVYDSFVYQGVSAGWEAAGGTSAAAPIVAAFDALGGSGTASPNGFIYGNDSLLNDVLSGNNGLSCTPSYMCLAGTGYDGPTGLGTINGSLLGTLSGPLSGYTPTPPGVSLGSTDGITDQTATLHGTVNPHGEATTYYFEWGTSPNAPVGVPTIQSAGSGTSSVPVSFTATNLDAGGQPYWVKLLAVNADGTRLTAAGTFTTKLPRPIAITDAGTNLTSTSADLGGTFEAQGLDTTYHFDYGPTTSYGSSTPEQDGGTPSSYANVTQSIGGLTPGLTYHFRFVATNSSGTTYGADKTFTPYATGGSAGGGSPSSTPTQTGGTTSTPSGTTANVSAPSVVIAGIATLSTVLSKGVSASVSCGPGCRVLGSLVLPAALAKKYKLGHHNVTVGTGHLSLAHGGIGKIVLHLSPSARKRLRHAKSLRLTLQLIVSDASGKTHTLKRTILIR